MSRKLNYRLVYMHVSFHLYSGELKNDCFCKLGYLPKTGRVADDDVYPK